MARRTWLVAAALSLTACETKAPQPTAAAPPGGTQDSWMFAVAKDAAVLKPFEQMGAGDGWLATFHNDLKGAIKIFGPECKEPTAPWEDQRTAGFPCVGLARAHIELAETYAAAAEVERVARRQFYLHRRTHAADVLPSAQQDFFEGVVLLSSGATDDGRAALDRYAKGPAPDPQLAALCARILAGLSGSDPLVAAVWGAAPVDVPADATFETLPPSDAAGRYRGRLSFIAAAARGDVAGATEALRTVDDSEPDLREALQGAEGGLSVELGHHDPAYLRARAWLHAHQALAAAPATGPSSVLHARALQILRRPHAAVTTPDLHDGMPLIVFSAWPHPADLVAALEPEGLDASRKRLAAHHPELGADASSDLSDLDTFIRGSNAAKEALDTELRGAAVEGAQRNMDLALSERLRMHLMRARAAELQRRFQVRMDADLGADAGAAGVAARSLLELVLDKDPSPPSPVLKRARISFRNDPPTLVELARANLDTRRPYDANEYVRPLTEAFPELVAVRDALSALDSAWNPARQGSVR